MSFKSYLLDLETTGLSEKVHDIIEISVIRYDDKVQFSRTIKAENPKMANLDALRITGRTMDDLKDGVYIKDALEDFVAFLKQDECISSQRLLVGHNIIAFDRRFLFAAFKKYGLDLPVYMYFDTMKFMRKHYKENKVKNSAKLSSCCDYFQLKKYAATQEHHSAKIDTRNNYMLYKHIQDNLNPSMIDHVENHPFASEDDEYQKMMGEFLE